VATSGFAGKAEALRAIDPIATDLRSMPLRFLLDMLAPSGARSRLSVLIFHRVRAVTDPLFPNEPDAARFEEQLRWIKQWFEVLPLADAVRRLRAGTLPARPLSITFDDGYADNATVALPILSDFGLSATFFIATGFLNGGRMWNDTVIETVRAAGNASLDLSDLGMGQVALDGAEAKRSAIDAILRHLKHLPQNEREREAEALARRVGATLPDDLMLSDAGVRTLHKRGMGIGAHTVSHPILATLEDDTARCEILESRTYLERVIGEPVTLFAYPNGMPGRDYTQAHVAMIREMEFAAAVSTAPGVAHSGSDIYQIPRFTPWDRAQWRYWLRLARNARHLDCASA
jgi:peptidoglycan/xylan/chitin deacetylase (PgdA/CDA1 family)